MAEEGRDFRNEGSATAATAVAAAPEGFMEGRRKRGSGIPLAVYFKEESNVVADLEDSQKKALDELKELLRVALAGDEFAKPEKKLAEKVVEEKAESPPAASPRAEGSPAPPGEAENSTPTGKSDGPVAGISIAELDDAGTVAGGEEQTAPQPPELVVDVSAASEKPGMEEDEASPAVQKMEEVFLWGVPLLGDEKSDTVLLKFLRARDFKVKESLDMIRNTVIWRKEFGIEGLLEEDLGMPELEKVVFMHGHDKEGHPVCYNVYGEFQDKDLYHKVFTDDEKRKRFLRWRIQFLERGIRRNLNFSPRGICSMVQVTDLKNSPGLGKRELRQATKQALAVLQDNYPEFVAKKVFINVPWWYLAFNRMISPFFTQRTRSKFVFAGPSKSSESLFEFIAPEQVPVQYGGVCKDNDLDFCTSDAATEVSIKPSTKHTIEIPISEPCVLVWELRVIGWDVNCGAEFVPCADDGYTVIVQKTRRFTSAGEPLWKNRYKVEEPGKIVLTVENSTSKRKKILYRSKAKSIAESV